MSDSLHRAVPFIGKGFRFMHSNATWIKMPLPLAQVLPAGNTFGWQPVSARDDVRSTAPSRVVLTLLA